MSSSIEASRQWAEALYAYASHINDYVARGDACGWKKMGEPNSPPDLQALLPELLSQLRVANAQGSDDAMAKFREQWPPSYEGTQSLLEANGQGIGALAWLPDGGLMVRIGTWYESGRVVEIRNLQVQERPEVEMLGSSPGQRTFATAGAGVITVRNSQDLSLLAEFPMPDGNEGLPAGAAGQGEPDAEEDGLAPGATRVQQLIPFDDGSAVVVVQSEGIFLLTSQGVHRLLPEADEMDEDDAGGVRLDMGHAAVSPDGRFIACGEQDGLHRIFDAQGRLVDRIGPHGEYPHHAAFFADGKHVALNACHFYNGGTIAVNVDAFGSIDTDFYEEHQAVTTVDGSARVYASAPVADALVLGDAHGYLWVRNPQGELQWKQHVGSTISAIAVSPDGQKLAVGTYAGVVHIIDLTNPQAAPEQIGVNARREVQRWLFWKQEARPLAW